MLTDENVYTKLEQDDSLIVQCKVDKVFRTLAVIWFFPFLQKFAVILPIFTVIVLQP